LPDINFSTARKAAIPPHAIKPKLTTNGVPDNFFRKDITLRKFLDSPGLNKN
jgi:hypothetical protein